MYILGSYEVIQQQDPPTGSMVNVFGPGTRVVYEPSLPVVMSRLKEWSLADCESTAPPVGDDGNRTEADAHIALWASHARTIVTNGETNHQQIAAPNGHIYWWLKLV